MELDVGIEPTTSSLRVQSGLFSAPAACRSLLPETPVFMRVAGFCLPFLIALWLSLMYVLFWCPYVLRMSSGGRILPLTSSLFIAMRRLDRAAGDFRWLALPCIRLCIPACINTRCWLVPGTKIVDIKRQDFCRAFLHLSASHLSDKASDILSDFSPQILLAPKLRAVKSGRTPITPPLYPDKLLLKCLNFP